MARWILDGLGFHKMSLKREEHNINWGRAYRFKVSSDRMVNLRWRPSCFHFLQGRFRKEHNREKLQHEKDWIG